jgi:hypothetical protein
VRAATHGSLAFLLLITCAAAAFGQASLVREGVETLGRAATKWFARKGVSESGEQLAKYGGRELVERVAKTLVREGGEEALEKAATLTAKYGPDVLRVIDDAPSPTTLLRALDDIPADSVGTAIARLGADGPPLQTLVQRYGSGMLKAELRNPGVSVGLVRSLGDDGLRLATSLGGDDAIMIARYADDIAALPAEQKEGVLKLLYGDTKRMVTFIGRFLENNPGATLFYGSATALLLANSERLLGGDEIVIDKDGNPIVVSKPGLVERTIHFLLNKLVGPVLYVLLPIVALGCVAWMAIKLYFTYQRERRLADNVAKPDAVRPCADVEAEAIARAKR